MKRSFLTLFLISTLNLFSQVNLQFHGDFGRLLYKNEIPERALFTATLEVFHADKLGSTFLFIDTDYRGKGAENQGAISAYWEIGRDFTFLNIGEKNSFSAHIEYNGGLSNALSFQQAALVGPAWNWHSADFSKILTLQTLYKHCFNQGQLKAHASFQLTGVWNLTFARGFLSFDGFADLWYGERPFTEKKGLIFLAEPQLWFHALGRNRENARLSFGTEVEISHAFVWGSPDRAFYAIPTLGVKYVF